MGKTITKKQKNKLLKALKNIIIYDVKYGGLVLDNELLNDLPYHMELADTLSNDIYYYELLEKQGYKINSLELVKEFTNNIIKELQKTA